MPSLGSNNAPSTNQIATVHEVDAERQPVNNVEMADYQSNHREHQQIYHDEPTPEGIERENNNNAYRITVNEAENKEVKKNFFYNDHKIHLGSS